MSFIDLSNYADTLLQSTAGRAGSPDGNMFFNTILGEWEGTPVEDDIVSGWKDVVRSTVFLTRKLRLSAEL